ncbi:MAG: lipopolysaccharide biosynthesis protein [Oscillospiraceae bacterium]|nr:lipopolysaccharide biosynthesis protein [Oscillospiraceae bacterium]
MNKYKQLATNTIIFAIGSFSSKILSFLLTRLYTASMTEAQLGVADLVVQGANLLIPILTLNIVESVMRYGLENSYDKQQVFSVGIRIMLMGMAAMTLLLPVLNFVPSFDGYLHLLYIFVFTSSFRAINQQFLRTCGHVKLYAFDGILTTFVMIILNFIFLLGFDMGTEGYLLSMILADLISALFIFFVGQNYRYLKFVRIEKDMLKTMVKFSIPLIPTAVLWWVVSSSDKFMISGMLGDDINGVYGVAYKIPSLISMVSTIFFQAWQMSAIKEYTEGGASDEAKNFFSKVFHAYQAVMYISGGAILLLLRPLITLFVDSDFGDPYIYTPFLILSVIMSCSCTFLSYIYSATVHTKNSFATSLLAAIVNIILNLILIPSPLGAQGAAIATAASYSICFIVRLFDSRRYIHFKVNYVKLILNIVLIVASTLVTLYTAKFKTLIMIILFIAIFIINFSELWMTVKKVMPISRRKKA